MWTVWNICYQYCPKTYLFNIKKHFQSFVKKPIYLLIYVHRRNSLFRANHSPIAIVPRIVAAMVALILINFRDVIITANDPAPIEFLQHLFRHTAG